MITRLARIAKIDYAPLGIEGLDGDAFAQAVNEAIVADERERGIAIVLHSLGEHGGWPVVTIVGPAADVRRARDAWGYDDDDAPIVPVGA